MIDWTFVFLHALWILGLSIVLAAFSYHDWLRRDQGRSLRAQLREPGFRLPLYAGLWLVAVSLASLPSSRGWERVLWVIVLLGATQEMWRAASEQQQR